MRVPIPERKYVLTEFILPIVVLGLSGIHSCFEVSNCPLKQSSAAVGVDFVSTLHFS